LVEVDGRETAKGTRDTDPFVIDMVVYTGGLDLAISTGGTRRRPAHGAPANQIISTGARPLGNVATDYMDGWSDGKCP
jgi:hypothetical protein